MARLNSIERVLENILDAIRVGKTSTPTANIVIETCSKAGSSNEG